MQVWTSRKVHGVQYGLSRGPAAKGDVCGSVAGSANGGEAPQGSLNRKQRQPVGTPGPSGCRARRVGSKSTPSMIKIPLSIVGVKGNLGYRETGPAAGRSSAVLPAVVQGRVDQEATAVHRRHLLHWRLNVAA